MYATLPFHRASTEAKIHTSFTDKKRMFTQLFIILCGWLLVVLVLFSGQQLNAVHSLPAATNFEAPKITVNESTKAYLALINDLRADNGKPLLGPLEELQESATNKATHMAVYHYWGHTDPTGYSFKDFIWNSLPSAEYMGENLAECFVNREAAFAALVASPTHLQVMLDDFDFIGVGEAYDSQLGCTVTAFHFAHI